jgi:catechol 2,3-dioxygenase-like lactoylglutathione lyase family enzyme
MIERIDHTSVVVRDLAAMTSFYEDVLGLRLAKRVTIRGDWIEAVTGLEKAEADVVYLEADSGAGLELMCYRTPQGSHPAGLGEPNAMGIRHIAFRVDDLDAMVARLKTAGVEFLSDVQKVPATQVDFAGRQKRIVYCRDREGNLLELCDFR